MFFGVGAGGALTLFNQVTLEKSLLEIQQQQVKTSFDLGRLNLNTIIESMETTALSLAHFAAEIYQLKQQHPEIDTTAIFKTSLFNTFSIVEQSIGGGIWFEPYLLDAKQRWYGPYVYREQEELIFTWELSTEEYDYHLHPWYKEAFVPENLNDSKVFWSDPYYDEAGTNALMVTVTAPILDKQGAMVGVTTVDWAIKHLREELLNIEFTERSSAFLADRDTGLFLSFPDSPASLFNPVANFDWGGTVLDNAKESDISRIEGVTFQQQQGTIFYINATSSLVLGIFLPDSDYLKYINQVTNKNLTFSLLISVCFLFVLILLLNKLFAPFAQILNAIRASISINKRGTGIKVSAIADSKETEFASITQALNQVYEQINEHAEHLTQSNQELKQKQLQINELNAHLEDKVAARTQELERKTNELVSALNSLQAAQSQMVLMEKNAALGQLVAGVAHEVNTPIGICITAASVLQNCHKEFELALLSNSVTRQQLDKFLTSVSDTLTLLMTSLERTDQLIESFKQVSIDQTNEGTRDINLSQYIRLVIEPMMPLIDKSGIHFSTQIAADLHITSYPGVLAQVINNLVMNSIQHAFAGQKKREIYLTAQLSETEQRLVLTYSDNGVGMPAEIREKVFEPFFTTKRGEGGVGLGMHITFNLVSQKLKGQIEIESQETQGTKVTISMPLKIE